MSNVKTNFVSINEGSLSRVMHHVKNRNVAILSASRNEHTADENKERNKQLEGDIRKYGYGFIKASGRYIENYKSDNEVPVDEDSYIVVGKMGDDDNELLAHAMELGQKYGQDSILHKPHDSDHAYLHGTKEGGWPGLGNKDDVGTFHPEKHAEFQSVLKDGRTFSFQNLGESVGKTRVLKQVKFFLPKSFFRHKEVEV